MTINPSVLVLGAVAIFGLGFGAGVRFALWFVEHVERRMECQQQKLKSGGDG